MTTEGNPEQPDGICTVIRPTGERCKARSRPTGTLCWAHDPDLSETRHNARVAGSRGNIRVIKAAKHLPPYLSDLQAMLLATIDEVKKGTVDARAGEAVARLAAQVVDIARFALETGEAQATAQKINALEAELREMAS